MGACDDMIIGRLGELRRTWLTGAILLLLDLVILIERRTTYPGISPASRCWIRRWRDSGVGERDSRDSRDGGDSGDSGDDGDSGDSGDSRDSGRDGRDKERLVRGGREERRLDREEWRLGREERRLGREERRVCVRRDVDVDRCVSSIVRAGDARSELGCLLSRSRVGEWKEKRSRVDRRVGILSMKGGLE
jgi:hypothetical protein